MVVKRFSSKLIAVGQEKLKTHTCTAKDETKKKNALQVLTHTGGRGRESNFKIH